MPSAFDKSYRCLEALASAPDGLTVSEIGRRCELSRPAATRLLENLAAMSLIMRDARKRYRLGLRLYELASTFVQRSLPLSVARKEMSALTAETGRSFHFLVPEGGDVVVIESSELIGGQAICRPRPERRPWTRSVSGHLFAALAPPWARESMWQQTAGEDSEALRTAVAATAQRGYAELRSTLHPGSYSIAVPIFDRTGYAVAAFASILEREDLRPEIEAPLGAAMLRAATRVSEDLGYHGPVAEA